MCERVLSEFVVNPKVGERVGVFRVLPMAVRRWYILLPLILVAFGASWLVYRQIPATYTASVASQVEKPAQSPDSQSSNAAGGSSSPEQSSDPDSADSSDGTTPSVNPYADAGATAQKLAAAVAPPPSGSSAPLYTVTVDSDSPLITVSANANSADSALGTVNSVTAKLTAGLAQLQQAVPTRIRMVLTTVAPAAVAPPVRTTGQRVFAVTLLFGILLSLVIAAAVERAALRRRELLGEQDTEDGSPDQPEGHELGEEPDVEAGHDSHAGTDDGNDGDVPQRTPRPDRHADPAAAAPAGPDRRADPARAGAPAPDTGAAGKEPPRRARQSVPVTELRAETDVPTQIAAFHPVPPLGRHTEVAGAAVSSAAAASFGQGSRKGADSGSARAEAPTQIGAIAPIGDDMPRVTRSMDGVTREPPPRHRRFDPGVGPQRSVGGLDPATRANAGGRRPERPAGGPDGDPPPLGSPPPESPRLAAGRPRHLLAADPPVEPGQARPELPRAGVPPRPGQPVRPGQRPRADQPMNPAPPPRPDLPAGAGSAEPIDRPEPGARPNQPEQEGARPAGSGRQERPKSPPLRSGQADEMAGKPAQPSQRRSVPTMPPPMPPPAGPSQPTLAASGGPPPISSGGPPPFSSVGRPPAPARRPAEPPRPSGDEPPRLSGAPRASGLEQPIVPSGRADAQPRPETDHVDPPAGPLDPAAQRPATRSDDRNPHGRLAGRPPAAPGGPSSPSRRPAAASGPSEAVAARPPDSGPTAGPPPAGPPAQPAPEPAIRQDHRAAKPTNRFGGPDPAAFASESLWDPVIAAEDGPNQWLPATPSKPSLPSRASAPETNSSTPSGGSTRRTAPAAGPADGADPDSSSAQPSESASQPGPAAVEREPDGRGPDSGGEDEFGWPVFDQPQQPGRQGPGRPDESGSPGPEDRFAGSDNGTEDRANDASTSDGASSSRADPDSSRAEADLDNQPDEASPGEQNQRGGERSHEPVTN